MSLIYLLSSLPLLSLDAPPAVSPEAFAEACRAQLSPSQAAAAEALLRGLPSDHPFVAAWLDKDGILRNAVARKRSARRGDAADSERWTRPTQGCDNQIETLVDDAFEETDPLTRERELDKIRWIIADELQGPDPLSIRAAYAYAIKLAITTRWHALDAERGRAAFDRLSQVDIPLNPEP